MSSDLELKQDEYEALIALSGTLDVLAEMFQTGEESVPGLRMAIASIRTAADILDGVANRWEQPA